MGKLILSAEPLGARQKRFHIKIKLNFNILEAETLFVFGYRSPFQFNRKRCQNQVFQKSLSITTFQNGL